MKNLKEYINESSLLTKIKYVSKSFMNDVRSLLGKEEKTYMPYIVIDKSTGWADNGAKDVYIWTKEAEYLFERMKNFLDDTTNYTTRKANKKDESKASIIEYSYSDMDAKEVRSKVWDKLCKIISDVNDELGTGEVDFTGIADQSKTKNKELALFPEEHKKYKIVNGSNKDLTSKWEWYWVEMQCDENGDSSYVEHGYYFYPGAMFCF